MVSNTSHCTGSETQEGLTGELIGIRVIVKDPDQACLLYAMGFYGKPFGVRKPGPGAYREVLELSLIEAIFLAEMNKLRVLSSNGKEYSIEELKNYAHERIPEFDRLYKVYKDLREKGLVVRSGLKFGTDYTVYRRGPGIEHAPFLVHVYGSEEYIDPTDLVRAGRLSHSVKKKFVMAIVFDKRINYLSLEWLRP